MQQTSILVLCGFLQIEPWPVSKPHPLLGIQEQQASHVNSHRQMKSVTTQTQMLPQGCKVAHTYWSDTQKHQRTDKSLGMQDMHVYSHMLWKYTLSYSITTHSFFYTGTPTDVHIHTLMQPFVHTLPMLKRIYHSHALCQALVSRCCIPRDTQHPHIQGPCLSTLVIMVNSWACYLIAAYRRLIDLRGYLKTELHIQTRSDDLCGVIWSFDSWPRGLYTV